MNINPLFQVGLDVMDRKCLVLGGQREAEEKSGRLLDAGARITLLTDEITPTLKSWAGEGRIIHESRSFVESDLDGAFLVLNTIPDNPSLTRQVWQLAAARNVLINSYDQPEYCNFGMVALVHPGHLRLSISTSNTSPSLASRLRQDLEQLFDEDFSTYLDALAAARKRVRTTVVDRPTRFALLRALVRDFKVEGKLHYPPHWQRHVEAVLSCELEHCSDEHKRCADCPLQTV
jgi:precorrin-2 dehydrogenase / sirohydrochlorin ferrochelatase